jgi:PAS domain S-box-containing protein
VRWQYTPYALLLLTAAVVSCIVALLAWRRRQAPGAKPLVWLMLSSIVWLVGNALETVSLDLPDKLFWANLQYFSIAATPVLWLVFALQYGGRERWLASRRNLALLAFIPAVTLVLVWTDDLHGLIRQGVRLDTGGPFPSIVGEHGLWFWVFTAYAYLVLILGMRVLGQVLMRRTPLYLGQAIMLQVAILVPLATNALYIFRLTPIPQLDLTPSVMTLSGLALLLAMFRYRLLDVIPVAHDAVFRGMQDGVIVLDASGRIVDVNPAAQRILGQSATQAIGQPYAGLISALSATSASFANGVTAGVQEVTLGAGEAQCHYDLLTSPLQDSSGRHVGWLIVLRDITQRKQIEKEREALILDLQDALSKVKVLSGLLPICASCKKIRDDRGYWNQLETYISEHTNADFTHGICPDCAERLYPQLYKVHPEDAPGEPGER